MAIDSVLESTPSSLTPIPTPRDSGYNTQSSQYITFSKQPTDRRNPEVVTNSETEKNEETEEYELPNWKAEAEETLRIARGLQTHLDKHADNLTDRRYIVDQYKRENPDYIGAVLAHCYEHPEDLPSHPLKQWALGMQSLKEGTKTHFVYNYPEPSKKTEIRCVKEWQDKLFGDWSFGDAWGSSRRIGVVGPKGEVDRNTIVASPPPGHSWEDVRRAQQLEKVHSNGEGNGENGGPPRKKQRVTIRLPGRR